MARRTTNHPAAEAKETNSSTTVLTHTKSICPGVYKSLSWQMNLNVYIHNLLKKRKREKKFKEKTSSRLHPMAMGDVGSDI
jgi:hypothetical protein